MHTRIHYGSGIGCCVVSCGPLQCANTSWPPYWPLALLTHKQNWTKSLGLLGLALWLLPWDRISSWSTHLFWEHLIDDPIGDLTPPKQLSSRVPAICPYRLSTLSPPTTIRQELPASLSLRFPKLPRLDRKIMNHRWRVSALSSLPQQGYAWFGSRGRLMRKHPQLEYAAVMLSSLSI
jgi:hypothetical protein